jgi:hypothetical protein
MLLFAEVSPGVTGKGLRRRPNFPMGDDKGTTQSLAPSDTRCRYYKAKHRQNALNAPEVGCASSPALPGFRPSALETWPDLATFDSCISAN